VNLSEIKYVYLIGIGGIGMSALARYFKAMGKQVAGYDKTRTSLTDKLESENIFINFSEHNDALISEFIKHPENTLVVYTPAIPKHHPFFELFSNAGIKLYKRAEILGLLSQNISTIAVAGTHGKTTTSTLIAHLLHESGVSVNAILGGISTNFNSNLLLSKKPDAVLVTEADEYDRSFLHLHPYIGVITSAELDHAEIYGSQENIEKSFAEFAHQCENLVVKKAIVNTLNLSDNKNITTYSLDDETADFYAKNIRAENEKLLFDCHFEEYIWKDLYCGISGIHNIENSIAAIAATKNYVNDEQKIRKALASFKGAKRRFEYIINTPKLVFIDDYAHHPTELKSAIESARKIYPNKKITGIFQPHLYSRTKDFAAGFAESLNQLDEVFLLDIYPARELPMEGVSSELIFKNIHIKKTLCTKAEILQHIQEVEVLLTLGAGDIDTLVEPIKKHLLNNEK